MRTEASYGWGSDGHVSETRLALQHFGISPLFVFDPADHSNAPVPGDLRLTWWPVYPRFLRDLFTHTFTVGLADASLGGRVTEGVLAARPGPPRGQRRDLRLRSLRLLGRRRSATPLLALPRRPSHTA